MYSIDRTDHFLLIIDYDKMNPTLTDGTSETDPLRRGSRTPAYLPVAAAGKTFGSTYFLV